MVKLKGPILSLEGTGSLAGQVTVSNWKGRPYLRQRVTPRNPRTAAQTGPRALFQFVTQQWQTLSAADQASYADLADQLDVAPYHAYVRANQQRWGDFKPPAQPYPAPEDDTPGVMFGGFPTVTNVERGLLLNYLLLTLNQNWGVLTFRSTSTGFATAPDNLIAVTLYAGGAGKLYRDSPLDPGTYYYNFRLFSLHGVLGSETGEKTGTVP